MGFLIHHNIREATYAICIKRYAKTGAIGANVSVKRYASKAAEQACYLESTYNFMMDSYDRDRDGNYYHTE